MVCANTEGLFRIIQSISSPRVEPLKLWLARVGYEKIQEIEDPELGQSVVSKKNFKALNKSKKTLANSNS